MAARAEDLFDWKVPDYAAIFRARVERLAKLRADQGLLSAVKVHYKNDPIALINDWGCTVDTRLVSRGLPAVIPFILFPKQVAWLQFTLDNWKDNVPGITSKSRDCGISWLAMSLSCVLCLHHDNLSIGFGSAKEDKVDHGADPDSLFYKGRMFMTYLPREFRGGWNEKNNSSHMKIMFPNTGASITGEAGDNIGRGGRKALFFCDEAAHLERPEKIDASLSATTDCRQDLSSVNGSANPFYDKYISGNIRTFDFDWRDDPRKDKDWYDKKVSELDPVIVAQEIDRNFQASTEGIVIPSVFVQAAIGAFEKLGVKPSGVRKAALDVADEGVDKSAFAIRHGNALVHCESWKGKGSDIFDTVERAFLLCDTSKLTAFTYDADGLGAGVRGDARKINERRVSDKQKALMVSPFRGSGAVLDPERSMVEGRKNIDFFENLKAMSWWALRQRFQATYRAVQGIPNKEAYRVDDLISIGDFPERNRLVVELSQPTWGLSKSGKVLIEKKPDGAMSPNLADACMMVFAPQRPAMLIDPSILEGPYAQR